MTGQSDEVPFFYYTVPPRHAPIVAVPRLEPDGVVWQITTLPDLEGA